MAAPGGLLFAKIIKPETEEAVEQLASDATEGDDKPANVIDAAAAGASSGMQLALNVGAMLLAFIGLIALINGMLGGIGGWFGMPELTLELILGYVFSPLAFLIGVPWSEATIAGSFIGQKLVVNEFVAYLNFAPYLAEGAEVVLSPKNRSNHLVRSMWFRKPIFSSNPTGWSRWSGAKPSPRYRTLRYESCCRWYAF